MGQLKVNPVTISLIIVYHHPILLSRRCNKRQKDVHMEGTANTDFLTNKIMDNNNHRQKSFRRHLKDLKPRLQRVVLVRECFADSQMIDMHPFQMTPLPPTIKGPSHNHPMLSMAKTKKRWVLMALCLSCLLR